MSKINLLDIHVANLIAAGEVVERPSSALKEIVENSIDAGASVITVEIKNGGITYMRVTDNGEGMTAEDLGRSILRHSTSKISSESDLGRIKTLGFRGEALAAISSVSDMKIFSRHRESDSGYLLETSSGQNTKISETGCAYGTTVVVERLFSKIPARQKFMKRDATEGMYCKSVIEKIALSNPFVSIRFIQDGKEKIFTPGGGSYKNTVYSIYKDRVGDGLIPIKETDATDKDTSGIKVSGFICRIDDCRNTRADENFFVNGRYVRSKTILSAIEEAYDSVADTGKFPMCVLYVVVDESLVDVNVHPQKLEVKFAEERAIFEAVYCAVKNTLESNSFDELFQSEEKHTVEDTNTDRITELSEPQIKIEVIKHNFDDDLPLKIPFIDNKSVPELPSNEKNNEVIKLDETDKPDEINEVERRGKLEKFETTPVQPDYQNKYRFIGEAFHGFIIVEKREKIIVIDKHAAHERIIYDKMIEKANVPHEQRRTQILLIPAEIKLDSREMAAMTEFKEDIEKIGLIFDFKKDDTDTVIVREAPVEISGGDANIEEVVREMAYAVTEDSNYMAYETAFEKLAAGIAKKTAACRAAMKNGIKDEPEYLMWLVDHTLNYEGVKYCPHGRPVAFEVTKSQLERQFKR